jgi:hypothetical protein
VTSILRLETHFLRWGVNLAHADSISGHECRAVLNLLGETMKHILPNHKAPLESKLFSAQFDLTNQMPKGSVMA